MSPLPIEAIHSKQFYQTEIDKEGQFMLRKQQDISIRTDTAAKILVKIYSGIRVLMNAWNPVRGIKGTVPQIITKIHTERFNSINPYVISGEHFVDLYPRNYGIFYEAALDARCTVSQQDWTRRQQCMLQTAALHLDLLSQSQEPYTTYMPLNKKTFVGVNIWTTPSDTLFSVLFTLTALTDQKFLTTIFPSDKKLPFKLQTVKQGRILLVQHRKTLKRHIDTFFNNSIDPKTHLVRRNIYLSGVRDHVKRESAFYDNVIIWATAKLANDLHIRKTSYDELIQWKKTILEVFWDEKEGIFLDDLSQESKERKIFCADNFITVVTQFLQPSKKEERKKIERIITYVKKHSLDRPFPVQYTQNNQPRKMYTISKILFPSYVGKAIFAHWGIEYIKQLILLGKYKKQYVQEAQRHLSAYTKQIKKYGGYPEIYNKNGNIFHTPFYKSVLHTGWVINYEQANMLLTQLSNSQ